MDVDLTQLNGWVRALNECPEKLNRENLASTRVLLHEIVSASREYAPVDDGALRSDIRVMQIAKRQGDAYTGMVGTNLVYSAQREYGGTIYPRNGKVLVFEVNGELVFAKKVEQEGSEYMKQGAEEMEPKAAEYYQLGILRALGEI